MPVKACGWMTVGLLVKLWHAMGDDPPWRPIMSAPDMSVFAQYIPGFEFLQNLSRQAAGGAAAGTSSAVPGMPPMSHWVAPTFDVEELDKRIQDLKAVHFWLDQNTKALAATIQALEVQKMTLATLKSMNVSMQDMADAFKIRPESVAASPEPEPVSPTPSQEADDDKPAVDPMQWWTALTQQFQTIATGAIKDMADQATRAAEQMAQSVQAGADAVAAAQPAETSEPPVTRKRATATRSASKPRSSGRAAPAKKAAAKRAPSTPKTPTRKR